MDCELFDYINITRDNLVVHMSFNESKTFKNEFNKSYYTEDYEEDLVIINRTDSNEQYFNMTFAEDFNLI